MNEKQFLKEQWLQLIFAASIILLSCILTPSNSQDDRVTIFGFKTPILCLHRLIYNKPCPGCGLTRSFVCFAHGDIRTSYNYHRLGIPLFIIILLQMLQVLPSYFLFALKIFSSILFFLFYFVCRNNEI